MFRKLKNRLFGAFGTKKAVFSHRANSELEFVFRSGGVDFFKYRDNFSIPADRALSATDIYEELNQRISRDYLKELFESITLMLDKGKLVNAASMIKMAQSRLEHIANAQLLMKLATVVYIAEWENAERFSLSDAEKKIAHWQEHEDVNDFFLRQPIVSYLPFTASSKMSSQTYLVQQNKEVERQLTFHLQSLSETNANSDLLSSVKLQLERTKQLTRFLQQE